MFVGFYAHSSVYSIYTYQKSLLTIFSKMLLLHLRDNFNNTEYIMMLQGPLLDTSCNGNNMQIHCCPYCDLQLQN